MTLHAGDFTTESIARNTLAHAVEVGDERTIAEMRGFLGAQATDEFAPEPYKAPATRYDTRGIGVYAGSLTASLEILDDDGHVIGYDC